MISRIPNDFNWVEYFELNPDVAKYYKKNTKQIAEYHWCTFGYKENRKYRKNGSSISSNKQYNVVNDEIIEPTEKKITVIIPNKNGQTPDETISSLYKQTYKNFDIVIINDFEKNANKARNEGLKKVTTEYVLFSDNDIIWEPTALDNMLSCLENNDDVSYAYGNWIMAGITNSNIEFDPDRLKKNNYISTMALVRTKDHPFFDESIKRFQDWDVWLTMLEKGLIGKYIGKKTFSTKIRKGITYDSISNDEATRKIKKKHNLIKRQITNGFSIVIPTMWMSNKIIEMLNIYEKSENVKEVIIIDNNPSKKIDLDNFNKVVYYTEGDNIFVNPSWNIGFSLAKYSLVLANDDILIPNLDDVLDMISETDYDIVGVSPEKTNSNKIYIKSIDKFPANSYGAFMYIKNFQYIPEQLKIWDGDDIQFNTTNKRAVLYNDSMIIDKNKTINSNINYFRNTIGKADIEEYNKLIKKDPNKINVVIRTSKRPLFFHRCVESIKKHIPNSKLHITVDNINDLNYVNDTCDGLDYNYYIINKQTVNNICKKIPIERDLFIYNYYFNVVKPFIYGWTIFLDDDDELVNTLNFTKNPNTFYLFKVDVGKKIVPSEKNFGKYPSLNDISGIGVLFHHTQMVNWLPQRGGDYGFIKELYNKYPAVWRNEILSKTQLYGNFGKQNDLKNKTISVNMATYPKRKESTVKTLNSLLSIDIVDNIRVYLNEYKSVPKEFPKSEKILYYLGEQDLKDSGKFFWAETMKNEYYFTVDDDLTYNKNYIIEHIYNLQKHNNEIFVTRHGKEMKQFPISFNDNKQSYHCLKEVNDNHWINNGGTGVMAFDNSKFSIPLSLFKYHGMTDLWISYYCQKNKIPILCVKHKPDLKYLLHGNNDTLFDKREELKEEHKTILQLIGKWELYKYEI